MQKKNCGPIKLLTFIFYGPQNVISMRGIEKRTGICMAGPSRP